MVSTWTSERGRTIVEEMSSMKLFSTTHKRSVDLTIGLKTVWLITIVRLTRIERLSSNNYAL